MVNTTLHRRTRGFTLVELLIVIVVIAILAAIAIVAYNGIQDRAYRAKTATAVDGAVKVLEMYRIDNGAYPAVDDEVCFTVAGSLPASDDLAANQCDTNGVYVSTDLNNALLTYVSSMPNNLFPTVVYDEGSIRSIRYVSDGEGAELIYMMNGDHDCPRGEKRLWYDGVTTCLVRIGLASDGGGGSVGM